jgi:DGQHR domain-containing protein
MARYELTLPALAVEQAAGRTLFSFAVDGKKLPLFAAVSRVKRDEHHDLAGYQRPESLAHIRTIRKYLESENAILPNALVVAFDSRVRFEPEADSAETGPRIGRLVIPVDEALAEHEKPGWIVDGQQRSAAIRDADLAAFPVYVTAFITDSVAEQRSQFILVNSTKPLPKGLIHELLPSTPAADLPVMLLKRRYPAEILDRLNYDPDSPLFRRIRTPTTAEGTIKDNSILKMISMSIEDGALYQWFDPDSGTGDIDSMLTLLKRYWSAVAEVFPEAWNSAPRRSRLVHGVGILALGCLMDEISYELRAEGIPSARQFSEHLRLIADGCRWMSGSWVFAEDDVRRWNELQNTPKDIKTLCDHLARLYRPRARAGTHGLAAA